jgi:glycosyltransferase involved in cell wall biosynthesis
MIKKMSSTSAKRLAIYLPTLVGGGAERAMLNLAIEFAKRGFIVDFVLAQCEGAFMTEFPDSINLVKLNPIHLKFGRSIFSLPFLVRYIRHERPVGIVTALHANVIALWAKRLVGVPLKVVITEQNTLSMQRKTQSTLLRKITSWLIEQNYPLADEIVAVSIGVAEDLSAIAKIPRDRITVLANPVITPLVKEKTKEKIDHFWFNPGEPPVIVSVGRLTAQKDFPMLIKAFSDVRSIMPVRLMILGDGPDREALFSLVNELGLEKDISMPGFIHNPYPYMAHASVYVLSSRWEGLPTVLIEALQCGTPVIATDCPSGPREILQGGKYGKLIQVGDQNSLSKAIIETLNSNRNCPPKESWLPYEADHITDEYLRFLNAE